MKEGGGEKGSRCTHMYIEGRTCKEKGERGVVRKGGGRGGMRGGGREGKWCGGGRGGTEDGRRGVE